MPAPTWIGRHSASNDYADYTDAYDQLYARYGGLAIISISRTAAGNPLSNPQQYIVGTDHFKKMSQELRSHPRRTSRSE